MNLAVKIIRNCENVGNDNALGFGGLLAIATVTLLARRLSCESGDNLYKDSDIRLERSSAYHTNLMPDTFLNMNSAATVMAVRYG